MKVTDDEAEDAVTEPQGDSGPEARATEDHAPDCVCRACCDARVAKNPHLARKAEDLKVLIADARAGGKHRKVAKLEKLLARLESLDQPIERKPKSGFVAKLDRMAANATRRQADALDKRADRQEDRAGKMARKHLRGGRRARKAMIAAESDRRKAERLRRGT